jgi:hypothetical protein
MTATPNLARSNRSQKCHTMKSGSHESLNNVTRMSIHLKFWFRSKNVLIKKVRQTKKHGRQRSANGVVFNYIWGHVWQLLTAVYNDK